MNLLSGALVDARRGGRRAALVMAATRPTLHLEVAGESKAEVALGIDVDGVDLGVGARIVATSRRRVQEEWTAHTGKAVGQRKVDHEELTVLFETAGEEWSVIVRVAADGFALRYVLSANARVLGVEHTRLSVPSGARAWLLEYQTWYETPRFGTNLANLEPGDFGFPILLETQPGSFILVSESDIDGRSSGAHARFDGEQFSVTAADAELAVEPLHRTPWRVFYVGSLANIVASTLVDDLAPAASSSAVTPRPGRAAWSWWSSQYSGAYLEVQKRFADFAAEEGWEHLLVDCGWDAAWVPELVAYASARGVQVHLWSAWSDLDGEEALQKLALWRSWGVAGIKVDFMESEARERYRWYDAIIAESARVGLMVNFHGSVIPRGWARTHPHVVSYEGIRGAEYYVFYGNPLTATHNVIQPFTRNVVGSMDYTPVTFAAPGRETSDAHELALSVVYESGITHFADDPDRYRERPLAARFLAELPASWDETRLLAGHPDTFALIARRRNERWFVGCIGAQPSDTTVPFDPADLIGGPADVWTISDLDGTLTDMRSATVVHRLQVPLAPHGGFVAVVVPTGSPINLAQSRAELPTPTAPEAVLAYTGESLHLPTNADNVRVPPGWAAARTASDAWAVTADADPPSGALVVVTLESPGYDGVPVVSHARIVTPLSGTSRDVSALPFLAARNAIGPVERNLANGGGDPNDGGPLRIHGREYTDGLGVSQDSEVRLAVVGTMRTFTGLVGIDDETPAADAIAEVLVDDRVVFRRTVDAASGPLPFEADVTDAVTLTLRTSAGAAQEAHVDWLTLRLSE